MKTKENLLQHLILDSCREQCQSNIKHISLSGKTASTFSVRRKAHLFLSLSMLRRGMYVEIAGVYRR
jgi:hypothetical protein